MNQATGLKGFVKESPVKVIAVTSGKGGVGKTNVSVNLSVALARMGRRVLLMDADLGMANVDVLLGLHPAWNLSHLINGERSLEEIIVDGPDNLKIIPAASGIQKMAHLSPAEHMGMVNAFGSLGGRVDVLVTDTAAGISDGVTTFAAAAHEVIVVVCDEPASITDAYALIKVLSTEQQVKRFHVLANMVRSADEGINLYRKLAMVCDRFLDINLRYAGAVPHDEMLRKAVQKQQPVVRAYPGSMASRAFGRIAKTVDEWRLPRDNHGGLQFFIEQIART